MNGEYISLETAKAINNLKKSRDNLVESALQMDKIVNEKQQMIEELKKELTEEKNAYIKMYNMYVEKDNIINELEKELDKDFTTYLHKDRTMRETGKTYKAGANNYRMHIYLRLQELKGSDKE